MQEKQMLIRMCGVEMYRGNFASLSIHIVDSFGEEKPLFAFNPDAVRIQGEELVRLVEELTKNGAMRIHPNAIEEF